MRQFPCARTEGGRALRRPFRLLLVLLAVCAGLLPGAGAEDVWGVLNAEGEAILTLDDAGNLELIGMSLFPNDRSLMHEDGATAPLTRAAWIGANPDLIEDLGYTTFHSVLEAGASAENGWPLLWLVDNEGLRVPGDVHPSTTTLNVQEDDIFWIWNAADEILLRLSAEGDLFLKGGVTQVVEARSQWNDTNPQTGDPNWHKIIGLGYNIVTWWWDETWTNWNENGEVGSKGSFRPVYDKTAFVDTPEIERPGLTSRTLERLVDNLTSMPMHFAAIPMNLNQHMVTPVCTNGYCPDYNTQACKRDSHLFSVPTLAGSTIETETSRSVDWFVDWFEDRGTTMVLSNWSMGLDWASEAYYEGLAACEEPGTTLAHYPRIRAEVETILENRFTNNPADDDYYPLDFLYADYPEDEAAWCAKLADVAANEMGDDTPSSPFIRFFTLFNEPALGGTFRTTQADDASTTASYPYRFDDLYCRVANGLNASGLGVLATDDAIQPYYGEAGKWPASETDPVCNSSTTMHAIDAFLSSETQAVAAACGGSIHPVRNHVEGISMHLYNRLDGYAVTREACEIFGEDAPIIYREYGVNPAPKESWMHDHLLGNPISEEAYAEMADHSVKGLLTGVGALRGGAQAVARWGFNNDIFDNWSTATLVLPDNTTTVTIAADIQYFGATDVMMQEVRRPLFKPMRLFCKSMPTTATAPRAMGTELTAGRCHWMWEEEVLFDHVASEALHVRYEYGGVTRNAIWLVVDGLSDAMVEDCGSREFRIQFEGLSSGTKTFHKYYIVMSEGDPGFSPNYAIQEAASTIPVGAAQDYTLVDSGFAGDGAYCVVYSDFEIDYDR